MILVNSMQSEGRSGGSELNLVDCSTRMNPLGLDPKRFEIVEDEEGHIVGCCQLEKLPEDKTLSLRTLIVRPDMRWVRVCTAYREVRLMLLTDMRRNFDGTARCEVHC
jgi:hypothetical protein